jgi:oligoribonuclease
MSSHQFLWVDLETTGLYPHEGAILEWAAVLAADDKDGDMSPVAEYSSVVHYTPNLDHSIDPYVQHMHTVNGLWDECAASDTTLAESEDFLCSLVDDLAGTSPAKGIILAGGSVHFDLAWIRVHMPEFAKRLHYRVFDVSTLKAATRVWGPGFVDVKANAHRALLDVRASLAEAKALRELFGLGMVGADTGWCIKRIAPALLPESCKPFAGVYAAALAAAGDERPVIPGVIFERSGR